MEPKCSYCDFFGDKPHCHNCKVFKGTQEHTPQKINCTDKEFIEYINSTPDITERFGVGDYKIIDTYTGERLKIVIIDTNKDNLADGSGKARVTLGVMFMDGLYEMNKESTNATGWKDSKMRTVYMERIFRLLPKIYRDNIKPVLKLTSAGSRSREIVTTTDKLFLFSEVEVTGVNLYAFAGEGEQYEYFYDPQYRRFDRYTWLRSPYCDSSYYFCYVGSGGGSNCNSANNSYGVAFGFCI